MSKIKQAFQSVKKDLTQTRKIFFDYVLSLSNEFARLTARIHELEQRVEELEHEHVPVRARGMNYQKSF